MCSTTPSPQGPRSGAYVPNPRFWLRLDGGIDLGGASDVPRLLPGTCAVRVPGGTGYDFDGVNGGIVLGDVRQLELTRSLTVSCWVNLRAYNPSDFPDSQIAFRGDDRGGLDSYAMTVHTDGTVTFMIQDSGNRVPHQRAPIPLNRWTHLLGSFNDLTGELRLYVNGKLTGSTKTDVRPMGPLDPTANPGLGFGNVQNPGPHRQPLNGTIADLRIYSIALEPQQAGFNPAGWIPDWRNDG
jgi:hypothetical protein